MQLISTIRNGYRIITESATFEVYGSLKMRSGYKYLVTNIANGRKSSIDRSDLLQAQREGAARVTQ
jgi:hypothetical protein